MRKLLPLTLATALCAALLAPTISCDNENITFFNPSFLNYIEGGQFPLTPGPDASFVFVRTVNKTSNQSVAFVVTAEIERVQRDDNGDLQRDESGNVVTELVLETHWLRTFPVGNASEAGVLYACTGGEQSVERVGLGDNLLPSDRGVFVNATAGGGGLGIQANVNPLSRSAGNFACGDTVVFEVIDAIGVPGNVKVRTFTLDASSQPATFAGPDTFVNYERFLQSQVRENEP